MRQGFATSGLHLTALQQILGRPSLEPAVTAARWGLRDEVT